MDLPEPPRVVFVQQAPCADAARAEDMLRRALAPSVAPHGGWTVTMRVTQEGAATRAEGEITDESEAPVAHRTLARDRATAAGGPSVECSALARAVGVWASLVLDAEVQRAQFAPDPAPPEPQPGVSVWPAPSLAPGRPAPDAHVFLRNPDDRRSAEIGVSWFLLGGTGAGLVVGPAVFAVLEAGQGWFLRPQILVGRTLHQLASSGDVYASWGATRFDACKRMAGNYLERRGIQLDACAGSDLGFLQFDDRSDTPGPRPVASGRTLPFLALGPSLALRGELGSDLSVAVGATCEVNVIRQTFADPSFDVRPSLVVGRADLAVSWRLR